MTTVGNDMYVNFNHPPAGKTLKFDTKGSPCSYGNVRGVDVWAHARLPNAARYQIYTTQLSRGATRIPVVKLIHTRRSTLTFRHVNRIGVFPQISIPCYLSIYIVLLVRPEEVLAFHIAGAPVRLLMNAAKAPFVASVRNLRQPKPIYSLRSQSRS